MSIVLLMQGLLRKTGPGYVWPIFCAGEGQIVSSAQLQLNSEGGLLISGLKPALLAELNQGQVLELRLVDLIQARVFHYRGRLALQNTSRVKNLDCLLQPLEIVVTNRFAKPLQRQVFNSERG